MIIMKKNDNNLMRILLELASNAANNYYVIENNPRIHTLFC